MYTKYQPFLSSMIRKRKIPAFTKCHRFFFTENAFRVFDLPLRFALDETALRNHYRQLMAQHHPDRSFGVSDDMASLITRSYDTLRYKHRRAMHLMELLGQAVDESSSGDLVGPEFLLEMMEAREEIERVVEDDQLRPLLDDNRRRMEDLAVELDQAVQNNDLETAKRLTARLQYLNRLEETIREKMDTID
ncbi:molecular chaperone HscB [Fistulifera solaris]|uniref:Molecular chaperone HscB n=1 Tax=Fistulifera solaris TaxID=1519565 RepID=A0A1Z5KRK9_FISSO|nr:molecular chaperone HscB [Fistulifera solaris]|eukprot:GAX28909.1 molecular chaperone HscB [Fistulifera solaris]